MLQKTSVIVVAVLADYQDEYRNNLQRAKLAHVSQEVTCAADLESNIERFKDARFIPFVRAENAAFIPDFLVNNGISNCTVIIDEADILVFNEDKPCDDDGLD